ncbi:MAG: hypothetical protein E3J65_00590 [Dehalococcoidia bacterium]|nr:MAG: hypothetical protein E3J65_00590 [Dehalococcoidia bacterium]
MNSETGELRARNFGDILGDTFRIYGRSFLRLVAIVAIVEVALAIIGGIVAILMLPTLTAEEFAVGPFILGMIVILAAYILLYPLMEGAVIHATSEQHFRPLGIGRAYGFAWKRIGALIGAGVLVFLAVLGMAITIIGIPFAIYFGVRWSFIWQAALLEGTGARGALSRSSALVKDNWWRVLGIVLVLGIIVGVISGILGLIPIVGSAIGAILAMPITIVGATLLYYDLRLKKEGYNLKVMAGEIGTSLGESVV